MLPTSTRTRTKSTKMSRRSGFSVGAILLTAVFLPIIFITGSAEGQQLVGGVSRTRLSWLKNQRRRFLQPGFAAQNPANNLVRVNQVLSGDELPVGKYELVGLFNNQNQPEVPVVPVDYPEYSGSDQALEPDNVYINQDRTEYNPRQGTLETVSDSRSVEYLRPPGSIFDNVSERRSDDKEAGPVGPLEFLENLYPKFAPGTGPFSSNNNNNNKRPRRQQVSSLGPRYPQFTPYNNPYSGPGYTRPPPGPYSKPQPDYTKPPYQPPGPTTPAPIYGPTKPPAVYGPTRPPPTAYSPTIAPYKVEPAFKPYSKPFTVRPTTKPYQPPPKPTPHTYTKATPEYDDHLPYQHTDAYSKHVTPTPKPYSPPEPELYRPSQPVYHEPEPPVYHKPEPPVYHKPHYTPTVPPYHRPPYNPQEPPRFPKQHGPPRVSPYAPTPKPSYAEVEEPVYTPKPPPPSPSPKPYHPEPEPPAPYKPPVYTPTPKPYSPEPTPVYTPTTPVYHPTTPKPPPPPRYTTTRPPYEPEAYRPEPEAYKPEPEPYRPEPEPYRPKPEAYRPEPEPAPYRPPEPYELEPYHRPDPEQYRPQREPAKPAYERPKQKYQHFPVVHAVPAITTEKPRPQPTTPVPKPEVPEPAYEPTPKAYEPTPRPYRIKPKPTRGYNNWQNHRLPKHQDDHPYRNPYNDFNEPPDHVLVKDQDKRKVETGSGDNGGLSNFVTPRTRSKIRPPPSQNLRGPTRNKDYDDEEEEDNPNKSRNPLDLLKEIAGVEESSGGDLVSTAKTFVCPHDGHFGDPEDCSKFYKCAHGTPIIEFCPSTLFWNQEAEQCDWPENSLCQFDASKVKAKKIKERTYLYLTFDDGPNPGTNNVVDVLAEENVPATFFINSDNMYDPNSVKAEANQRSLLKIVDGGHMLADHSFDHMSHNSKDSPKNAYQSVSRDLKYFGEMNIDPVLDLLWSNGRRDLMNYVNYTMSSFVRMPYTNNWRVPSSRVHHDCFPCTIPASSGQAGIDIADRLSRNGKDVIGWDDEWGVNWASKSLKYGGAATYQRLNRRHTKLPQKIVLLMHDVAYGTPEGAGELSNFIRLAKESGYIFSTLDRYSTDRL